MSVDLRGVFVPCTSPFDSTTGELDVIGLETNLDSYLNHPVRGIESEEVLVKLSF
jgi:dihydrodipicolinate synthase/N-acetylneuraminate lyase